MKKVNFKYVSYKGVVSNTVPGRCYSIAELLQRVMRGQPLPQVGNYQEETSRPSDKDIDKDMAATAENPLNDRDSDEIEAFNAKASIDEHIELFEEQKKCNKS